MQWFGEGRYRGLYNDEVGVFEFAGCQLRGEDCVSYSVGSESGGVLANGGWVAESLFVGEASLRKDRARLERPSSGGSPRFGGWVLHQMDEGESKLLK